MISCKRWTPRDIISLLSLGTACVCLLTLVVGVVLGVLNGNLSPEQLGGITGVGVGGGLISLAFILYQVIKVSLE